MKFDDFPFLECVEKDGKVYSLSNRRLYVARVLFGMGVVTGVSVDLLPFQHPRVHRVKDSKTKRERAFSIRNDGLSVIVQSRYRLFFPASKPHAPMKVA